MLSMIMTRVSTYKRLPFVNIQVSSSLRVRPLLATTMIIVYWRLRATSGKPIIQ
jgi:hypothetical protein